MNEKINIALASDNNYAQHVAVVAASILSNTSAPQDVCFYLLSDGITNEMTNKIKSTINNFGAALEVCDLSAFSLFEGLFTSGHISKAAYFRLDIPNILPVNIHKVIYMDVDLLVLHDVQELWNLNMQGKPIAAVEDYGIMSSKRLCKQKEKCIGLPIGDAYFNSGVVIMDLAAWRTQDYTKQVIDAATQGNFPHHDQDALNKIFMHNWQVIPLKWNVIPPVFNLFIKILLNSKLKGAAIAARKNIAILHYAGRYKPWEFEEHAGFNDKYYYYLSKTAFADVAMPQPSKNMKGKSIKRQLFRLWLANKLENF